MRDRSSPGIRKLINMNPQTTKDSHFDDIYKSVERLGGIGAAKSMINLERVDLSQASTRGRQSPSLGEGKIKAIRSVVKED
jgi:hypothetical protein